MAAVADIRPYWHLVKYAEWAYDNHDGRDFRANLSSPTELEGPRDARKVFLSAPRSHNHAHLGIRNGNTLVIAFRGTDVPFNFRNLQQMERYRGCWRNLKTDVNPSVVHPTWISNQDVLVHGGFLRDFNELTSELIESIRAFRYPTGFQHIEICGHSLGGALATLCALWCSLQYPGIPITCLTLGSPRVGNVQFAAAFGNIPAITCYRLFIQSDPIPTVPNIFTEAIANFCFQRREHGPQNWSHVGLALPINRLGASCPLRGAFERVTLAAHHPWNYASEVQHMLGY
jgi:hypothetical protein